MNNNPNTNLPPEQNTNPIYFAPVQPSAPPPSAPEPSKKPETIKRRLAEILFAWGALLLMIFFMEMRGFSEHPFGVFLALNALTAVSIAYLAGAGVKLKLKNLALELVLTLLSLALILNGNPTVRGFVIFFTMVLVPFRIAMASGLLSGWLLGKSIFTDLLRSYLMVAFRYVGQFYASLFFIGFGKKVARIMLGLALALVPTLIIVLLLSYDARFTELLNDVFRIQEVFGYVGSFLLAVPLAMFLFGSLFKAKRLAKEEDPSRPYALKAAKFPSLILCSAVTPILLVYILFFVSQAPYYLSAFTKTLPEGLTFADYAKEGFFQLCTVSAINAVLLLLFSIFTRSEQKSSRIAKRTFSALISVFTLILIATAFSKMVLYIESYGLTQKRVYAAWLMLLLAVGFVAVLLRQCFQKFPLAAVLMAAAIIFSGALVLSNTDARIADYNVDAYIRGDLPTVDVVMLEEEIGVSAVPALVKLQTHLRGIQFYEEGQAMLLTDTDNALVHIDNALREREKFSTFSFTLPDLIARKALRER